MPNGSSVLTQEDLFIFGDNEISDDEALEALRFVQEQTGVILLIERVDNAVPQLGGPTVEITFPDVTSEVDSLTASGIG